MKSWKKGLVKGKTQSAVLFIYYFFKSRNSKESRKARDGKTEKAVYARPRDAASLARLRRKESGFGRRRS